MTLFIIDHQSRGSLTNPLFRLMYCDSLAGSVCWEGGARVHVQKGHYKPRLAMGINRGHTLHRQLKATMKSLALEESQYLAWFRQAV